MSSAKISLKVGNIELAYEGDPGFVPAGLLDLVSSMVDLSREVPNVSPKPAPSDLASPAEHHGFRRGELTITTIAAHLQPDGPQELIMCALAKLQIVDGKAKVERSEITTEAKNATSYFKSTMSANFARDLTRMVRMKRINELSNGVYSLTAASRQELESKIASIG